MEPLLYRRVVEPEQLIPLQSSVPRSLVHVPPRTAGGTSIVCGQT